jgi:hypothetical protein
MVPDWASTKIPSCVLCLSICVTGLTWQTGSAHAYLTAYYLLSSAQRSVPSGVVEDVAELVQIDAKQVSPRGGNLLCNLEQDGLVGIVGTACEMARGTLAVW